MASTDNAPSVDFTVEPNVNDQKDFMTACTGKVNYATQGVQPTTSLDFRLLLQLFALLWVKSLMEQNH